MKTTLTLNSGSFYFLSTISLLRGQSQEVDVSSLTLSEKRNLLSHINSGNITSTEDLGGIVCDLSTSQEGEDDEVDEEAEEPEGAPEPLQAPPEALRAEESTEVADVEEDADEDEPDDSEIQDQYTNMTKKELRAEIKRRGLTEEGSRNDQLRHVLREADKA